MGKKSKSGIVNWPLYCNGHNIWPGDKGRIFLRINRANIQALRAESILVATRLLKIAVVPRQWRYFRFCFAFFFWLPPACTYKRRNNLDIVSRIVGQKTSTNNNPVCGAPVQEVANEPIDFSSSIRGIISNFSSCRRAK